MHEAGSFSNDTVASLAENSSEIFKTDILEYAAGITTAVMVLFDVLPLESDYINKTKRIVLVLFIQKLCSMVF